MSRWGRDIDEREETRGRRPAPSPRTSHPRLRDLPIVSRHESPERGGDGENPAPDGRERRARDNDSEVREGLERDKRERVLTMSRSYLVSERNLETMEEIGKFRAVELEDLSEFRFNSNPSGMRRELHSLSEQGLIRRHTLLSSRLRKIHMVTLTAAGKRLVDQQQRCESPDSKGAQQVYAGLKKIAEIEHDTAIYRMYQAEAKRIRSSGGKIRRVVLDYELKKKVFSPLAKARQVSLDFYQQRQREVASENGLRVVDGKIRLPDLRIEYETRTGEIEKVDLELATGHYRGTQLAGKSRAGFKLFRIGPTHSRGTSVREECELTKGILSL